MKLHLEVTEETFERIASGDLSVLEGRLPALEVTQEGGLLTTERRILSIAEMTGVVAKTKGVGPGAGPAIRVHLGDELDAEKKED